MTHISPRLLADRAIEEITSRDLHDCAAVVWREKPATAKKLNQILKATFDNAISRELIDADPWERAKKGLGQLKDKGKNQESLAHSEVGGAIQTIRETSAGASTKLAFEFLVLAAARSGEVRGADWRESRLGKADVDSASLADEEQATSSRAVVWRGNGCAGNRTRS